VALALRLDAGAQCAGDQLSNQGALPRAAHQGPIAANLLRWQLAMPRKHRMQGIRKERRQRTSSVIESSRGANPAVLASMPYAGQLTLEDMAWCAGVAAPRLRSWAATSRLKHDPPFTEHDAVEAAIAFSLVKKGVSQKTAPGAWKAIRPHVRTLLLAGTDDPWVVVGADGPLAEVCPDAASAAEAASRLGRCWLFPLRAIIDSARGRYASLTVALDPKAGEVAPIRAAKSSA
jgi:hypothetical protein